LRRRPVQTIRAGLTNCEQGRGTSCAGRLRQGMLDFRRPSCPVFFPVSSPSVAPHLPQLATGQHATLARRRRGVPLCRACAGRQCVARRLSAGARL